MLSNSTLSLRLCFLLFFLQCSWQNDVFVVAEPGELAEKFVESVKFSLLTIMRDRHRKYTSAITNISTLAELVACRPYFQIGCIVHKYIGRQTQVCFLALAFTPGISLFCFWQLRFTKLHTPISM